MVYTPWPQVCNARSACRGGRGPGGGSPLAGVRGQSPRKKIFGFGTPSQAENLQESAPPEPPWACLLACLLSLRLRPLVLPACSSTLVLGPENRAAAGHRLREWNAHGRGNSAASRVQGMCSVFAHFRERDRARNRGHIGEAGEVRGNRVARPGDGRVAEKVVKNTCFQPYPGHLDSGVRFRTLITSCARSGLTQDSLGGGRGPGGGSPLAGVRGQSPRKEKIGFGAPSQARNLQESASNVV